MLHLLMSWQTWNLLTTWHTFWRLDALFDVMSNFRTSWCVLTFCWHDVFLTPWPAFCRLTYLWHTFWRLDALFDVMSKLMTSWCVHTFCWHDVFLTPLPALCRLDIFMTHFWRWQTFWRYDVCCTYWCNDKHFDVMEPFDNMTHFLTSWRTFWRNVEV